LKIETITKQ